jgi:hypothetical protein
MALYAEDAMITDKPWQLWEFRYRDSKWCAVQYHPIWDHEGEYRRKPKTIIINGFEVPEPMRVRPAVDTTYFYPHLFSGGVRTFSWEGDDMDERAFKSGLCHLTKEAAGLHLEALMSFTALEDLS